MMTLKLLLLSCFVSFAICQDNKKFADLVDSIEDVFIEAEEEEMVSEEDEDEEEDNSEPDLIDYPEELDLRRVLTVHEPIYQGGCGSCGWVSGTHALEARIGLISENYIPYSIQNFMNCAGKTCTGTQPYSVTTIAKNDGYVVPENEIPYTQKECLKEGEGMSGCYEKCGKLHPDNFANALNDQFAVIVGTGSAHTEAQLIAALQDGPVTTCYTRKQKPPGELCKPGCDHANSIIGYTKDNLLLQESAGKKWGPFQNGTWVTPKHGICGAAIIQKAYYPKVLYDYDRANAYFTNLESGVKEEELSFVDKKMYGITGNDIKNWGTTKNKCAFLGSACKGVVALSSGIVELVSDFGAGSPGPQKAYKKFQMVIYLKDEETGLYIGIKQKKKSINLVPVKKGKAAPFFTSYARFVSFDYPTYRMSGDKLVQIGGSIRDIALNFKTKKEWSLSNCMIYNAASSKSFDVVTGEKGYVYLGSAAMDKTSLSQRFDVGISGKWYLTSNKIGVALAKVKNGEPSFVPEDKKTKPIPFLWQARNMMDGTGNAIGSDMQFSKFEFDANSENTMTPKDCFLSTDDGKYLQMTKKKVATSSKKGNNGWTFEYKNL